MSVDYDEPYDEQFWDEVRQAVGTGTRSLLWGTSTRSLHRSLAEIRAVVEKQQARDAGEHFQVTAQDGAVLNCDPEHYLPPGPVDFDKLTRQKQLADAILIERTVNVLLRRGFLHLPLIQQLGQFAADLRRGAEGD